MRDALALQIVHNSYDLADVVSVDTVHLLLSELLLLEQVQKPQEVAALAELCQQVQLFPFPSDDNALVN